MKQTFFSIQEAAGAVIDSEVACIQTHAFAPGGPVFHALFTRDTRPSPGGFQSRDGAFWQLASDPVMLEMFGAIGDGKADDTAAFETAKALGRTVHLPRGRTYVVTRGANPAGLPMTGQGRVVAPVTGGLRQINSQANQGPVVFRHHLFAVRNRWLKSHAARIVILGDSTATDAYGLDLRGFVTSVLRGLGLPVRSVASHAVAGHAWGTRPLAGLIEPGTDLVIIKFGINDAAGAGDPLMPSHERFRWAMRQRLSEIRQTEEGATDRLSILLIGPHAITNTAANTGLRNNLWNEGIRPAMIEAARDFLCCLYDPYPESADATGSVDRWMDAHGVHPQPATNADIWGRALTETCAPFGRFRGNAFVNVGRDEGHLPRRDAPAERFPQGISIHPADPETGFPFPGMLVTTRNPDGMTHQMIVGRDEGHARMRFRQFNAATGKWSRWSAAGVPIATRSGWVGARDPDRPPLARRTAEGMVVLSGALCGGDAADGTVVAVLDPPFRPVGPLLLNAVRLPPDNANAAPEHPALTRIRIEPDGRILIHDGGDPAHLGLDGLCYFANP